MWFRYYVSEHISKVMAQIETKEGMLQLGHFGNGGPNAVDGKVSSHDDFQHSSDAVPHADGNFVDRNGQSWAADTEMMGLQVDVSKMMAA